MLLAPGRPHPAGSPQLRIRPRTKYCPVASRQAETSRAIHCACAIRDTVPELGIEIRAGLHTGEVERKGQAVTGLAVQVGARVAALAREVLVTSTVQMLVPGSGIGFVDRGNHPQGSVPDRWHLFAVEHT